MFLCDTYHTLLAICSGCLPPRDSGIEKYHVHSTGLCEAASSAVHCGRTWTHRDPSLPSVPQTVAHGVEVYDKSFLEEVENRSHPSSRVLTEVLPDGCC